MQESTLLLTIKTDEAIVLLDHHSNLTLWGSQTEEWLPGVCVHTHKHVNVYTHTPSETLQYFCMNMCPCINGILSISNFSFSLRKASWGANYVETHLHLPPSLSEAEPSIMKLSCISSSIHSVSALSVSLRLGQHSFVSMVWALRRCHIEPQLGWEKGTCLLWPVSVLQHPPTLVKTLWPLGQVAWGESELWRPHHSTRVVSPMGPFLLWKGPRGWATQNSKRDMYFSRLGFGCFYPEHLLISYMFLGTWLNLFKASVSMSRKCS